MLPMHQSALPKSTETNNVLKCEIMEIINLDNVECKSQFEVAVIMRLKQICADVKEIKEKQIEIAEELSQLKASLHGTNYFSSEKLLVEKSINDFQQKYQLQIPMDSYEDFQKFEEKLKTDSYFKRDVCIVLQSKVAKDWTISKSMVKILKHFLTKELAMQFTAIRVSKVNKDKYKFKPTELCSLMEGIISKARNEKLFSTTQDDLNSALSDVLTNVTKWKSTIHNQQDV